MKENKNIFRGINCADFWHWTGPEGGRGGFLSFEIRPDLGAGRFLAPTCSFAGSTGTGDAVLRVLPGPKMFVLQFYWGKEVKR